MIEMEVRNQQQIDSAGINLCVTAIVSIALYAHQERFTIDSNVITIKTNDLYMRAPDQRKEDHSFLAFQDEYHSPA